MSHPPDTKPEELPFSSSKMDGFVSEPSQRLFKMAGSGKSAATDTVHTILGSESTRYTSLTLASLHRRKDEFTGFHGHLVVDDLGGEKSLWSRTATITVLANLTYTHYVTKLTMSYEIEITDFQGSAALNIQPILMQSLVEGDDWIAVVRDKVLRYYHLIRPTKPKSYLPTPEIDWGEPLSQIKHPKSKGRLWYQLIAIGLTQWSYARCLEHIPALLRASAALDGRLTCNASDYRLLIKLLKPMQLERYIISSVGFESGRYFQNNTYCILVELVSHRQPSIGTICEDYKVSPRTVRRLIKTVPEWCWLKSNSPVVVMPTEESAKILSLIGAYQKW